MRRTITLSRTALGHNLGLLAARRDPADTRLDLRADAYGHGAEAVADVARDLGFTAFTFGPADPAPDADAHLLYGITADARAVMTVAGEVVAVKSVPAGSAVSYGYTYRMDHEGDLALVGLGYADGVPRTASSRAFAAVNGGRCRIAGRIAMDQLMLDLGTVRAVAGDEVVLWGSATAPTLHEWAEATGYPPLALTAGLGVRFRREWTA
jgi:alanine racemase